MVPWVDWIIQLGSPSWLLLTVWWGRRRGGLTKELALGEGSQLWCLKSAPTWLLSPRRLLLQGLSSGPWLQQDGLDFLTAWPVGSSWKLSWLFTVRLGAGAWLVPIEFCWSKVRGPLRVKVWGRAVGGHLHSLWPPLRIPSLQDTRPDAPCWVARGRRLDGCKVKLSVVCAC